MSNNVEREGVEKSAIASSDDCIDTVFSDRLAILHELYQQKHAELVAQLQQSQDMATQEYIQSLQLLQQQQQSLTIANVTTPLSVASVATASINATSASLPIAAARNPFIGNLRQTSSEQSTDDVDMQDGSNGSPLSLKDSVFTTRNRRTFSGSGQTISQTTRDRLKTMIASKKQKQKLYGSCSTESNSVSNVSLSALPGSNGRQISDSGYSMRNSLKENRQFTASTPHFEPYPLPSPVTSSTSAVAAMNSSEFQLRKTSSEPNLKMRLRQRLLNKGSSPVTHYQSTSFHNTNQICDSDFTPIDMLKTKVATSVSTINRSQDAQSTSNLQQPLATNAIIPSPSLPNLCNSVDSVQMDYAANLMMQASFASFLSLPSLLKNPLFQANSMLDPCSAASSINTNSVGSSNTSRATVKFDNRFSFTAPLPAGGYSSLLKQQLRDLVLRRKSLVREEPEDESAIVGAIAQRWQQHNLGQNTQLKTGLAYDAAMSKHQCLCSENHNHVEHGGRVQSIWSRLMKSGLVNMCERLCVKKASLELLKLVHSSTYVTFFAVSPTACVKLDPADLPLKSFVQLPCGGIGVDSDTYFNDANTQMAIRVAVGLLVELACQVVEGKLRNGFACIRPPGHHAEREQAMGFCFFNNVSITARHLQQRFANLCHRIAIVDWDVHHGNGTQLCFEADSEILYLSMHRHDNGNFFPGTGAVTEVGVDEGKGFTVNIPFSGDVMGDAEYLAAWRVLVLPLLDSFKPNVILVSSGFDAAKGHPAALGGYEISPQLFGYFTRSLMSFANGKIVLALEGGYDLSSICEAAEECVKALCADGGDISCLSPEVLDKVPNQSAQETIQKVIAVHKKHWPCLTGIQGINTSELHWQTISHRFSSLTVHS